MSIKGLTLEEKKKKMEKLAAKINKEYGGKIVMTAAQAKDEGLLTIRRIETPSLEINNALYGGFGGIVELFGPPMSGKTSLMIETIKYNQDKDPTFMAAWLETEGSITAEILEDHGLDMSRVYIWDQADVGNAENALDISRGFLADGTVDLLVINSVAGLATKTEIESDMEKQIVGVPAKMMSKYFKVSLGHTMKNKVTMVVINQVRDKVGQMFGNPETTPGGRALGFYAFQRLRTSQVKLDAKDPIKSEDGIKINVIVKKNRLTGKHNPYVTCSYYALFESGIDSVVIMPQLLMDKGIMKVNGAHWYYYDDNNEVVTIDGIVGHFKSKGEFTNVLRENEAWREEMTKRLNGMKSNLSSEEIMQIKEEEKELENDIGEIDKKLDIEMELFEDD